MSHPTLKNYIYVAKQINLKALTPLYLSPTSLGTSFG